VIIQSQKDIIEFLSRPETYGPAVKRVERIDTHVSVLFLAGNRAFKLKRAVKFPYLDFSTVAKRRDACEAEVRINRRTAPDIYLGTVAVTKSPKGKIGLSGSGKSRLAQALAPRLGAVPGARVARSDVLRKRMAGVSIYEKLQAQNYSSEMTQKTYDRVLQECETSLKAGYWAIADAVFARPDQRSAIENVAENMNIPFYGLWLDAPEPVLKSRVDARREDASDADVNVVDQQMGYELGAISWRRINSGESMKKTIESAMLCLNGFFSPAAGKD